MRQPSIDTCQKCWGGKLVADTKDQEPWSAWTNLPVSSAAAVITGLIRPLICPACGGTGKSPIGMQAEDVAKRLTGDHACWQCYDQGFTHAYVPIYYTEPPDGATHDENRIIRCTFCEKFENKEQVKVAHAALCGCDTRFADDD